MRKSNPTADKITKHVLQYLLNRFTLAPGDINNIRLIVTRALGKPIKETKQIKNSKKGPID